MLANLRSLPGRLPRRSSPQERRSVLIILSHAPYDGDSTWNALRLAGTLAERGSAVCIFIMNDAIDVVRAGSAPEGSEFDLQAMLRDLLRKGVRLKICTTCVNRCGIGHGEVIPEAVMATMADLAEWIVENDRSVVF